MMDTADLLHKLAMEADSLDDTIEYMETEGDMDAIRYYMGKLEGIERSLHIVQSSMA